MGRAKNSQTLASDATSQRGWLDRPPTASFGKIPLFSVLRLADRGLRHDQPQM